MRAGTVGEIRRDSGEWIFVDLGFSRSGRTCGILRGDEDPEAVTFGDLQARLLAAAMMSTSPLNLLIEAPLSVAFTQQGNPTGRSFERRARATRYWYVGLGCTIMVAATYLVKALSDAGTCREIRLFEGFVSFKEKGIRSSHTGDVVALRDVVWHPECHPDAVTPPERLAAKPTDQIRPAFRVLGLETGVPPVVTAKAKPPFLRR